MGIYAMVLILAGIVNTYTETLLTTLCYISVAWHIIGWYCLHYLSFADILNRHLGDCYLDACRCSFPSACFVCLRTLPECLGLFFVVLRHVDWCAVRCFYFHWLRHSRPRGGGDDKQSQLHSLRYVGVCDQCPHSGPSADHRNELLHPGHQRPHQFECRHSGLHCALAADCGQPGMHVLPVHCICSRRVQQLREFDQCISNGE